MTTIAQYVRVARHPEQFRVDVVRAALAFWQERADTASAFQGGEARAFAAQCRESIAARTPISYGRT